MALPFYRPTVTDSSLATIVNNLMEVSVFQSNDHLVEDGVDEGVSICNLIHLSYSGSGYLFLKCFLRLHRLFV